MKAIARIFTLLICLVSFAGFGNTTSDQVQNSEVVSLSTYDVGVDNVTIFNVESISVDMVLEGKLNMDLPYFVHQKDTQADLLYTQESKQNYLDGNRSYNSLRSLFQNNINSAKKPIKNSYTSFTYRNPRDGISWC